MSRAVGVGMTNDIAYPALTLGENTNGRVGVAALMYRCKVVWIPFATLPHYKREKKVSVVRHPNLTPF